MPVPVTPDKFEEVRREDLVVLMYARNTCYTTVLEATDISVIEMDLAIDLKRGLWGIPSEHYMTYQNLTGWHLIGEDARIGRHGSRGGVIGVYNRTKINHLSNMASVSQDATKPEGSALED